jgi:hypothetical protein
MVWSVDAQCQTPRAVTEGLVLVLALRSPGFHRLSKTCAAAAHWYYPSVVNFLSLFPQFSSLTTFDVTPFFAELFCSFLVHSKYPSSLSVIHDFIGIVLKPTYRRIPVLFE